MFRSPLSSLKTSKTNCLTDWILRRRNYTRQSRSFRMLITGESVLTSFWLTLAWPLIFTQRRLPTPPILMNHSLLRWRVRGTRSTRFSFTQRRSSSLRREKELFTLLCQSRWTGTSQKSSWTLLGWTRTRSATTWRLSSKWLRTTTDRWPVLNTAWFTYSIDFINLMIFFDFKQASLQVLNS